MNSKLDIAGEVHSVLNTQFGDMKLGGLAIHCKDIELEVVGILRKAILDYFSSSYKRYHFINGNEFRIDRKVYALKVGGHIKDPTLEFYLLDVTNDKETFVSEEIIIEGVGYYTKCECFVTEKLKKRFENITNIIRSVYHLSYLWLEETMMRGIKDLESDFTNSLYKYLKMVFAEKGKLEFTECIWFSVFSTEDGYYALDSNAISRIIRLLRLRKYSSDYSPAYHISSLVGLQMPTEKSFSKHVISNKGYKQFSLPKADYISDMSDIYKTEEQMTQKNQYAIFHLAKVGNRELVVSFPADKKKYILPILKTHKSKLADIYKTEVNSMQKHINNLKASYRRATASEVSSVIGSFVGGLARGY